MDIRLNITGQGRKAALPAIAAALAGLLFTTTPIRSQDAAAEAVAADVSEDEARLAAQLAEEQRRLREISEAAEVSRERAEDLREGVSRLRDDRAQLNSALIETARTVSRLETDVTTSEAELDRLQSESATLRISLGLRRASLAETLRAMQRLGANPPPAVFTAPDNALDAIRAANLLGHAMPALRDEAAALSADLRRLAALTDARETEHGRLVARLTELSEERARVELLVEEKRRSLRASEAELAETRSKAETLAAEASSMQDLIARMETEIAATRTAAEQAAAAAQLARTAELERLALENTARLQPAMPFTAARGLLPRPTSGVVTTDWGDEDGFGGRSEGLTMVTRTGAQVVSPTDAWVVYAGPYRSYGQLVILNAGEDHHVLLAGMARIDVELGQFVLAGEPVAAMGGRLLASASVLAPQSTQPALYIEFRRNGQAIDPTPWWSDGEENQKVRG